VIELTMGCDLVTAFNFCVDIYICKPVGYAATKGQDCYWVRKTVSFPVDPGQGSPLVEKFA